VRTIPVAPDPSPRDLLFDELHEAIAGIRAPVHDGPWALATLELCLGAIESARAGREFALRHQVAVRR
jgi:phthalate 4,5-cis-dihydrodiol dehydrogenase